MWMYECVDVGGREMFSEDIFIFLSLVTQDIASSRYQ
jgi:hypothetical protein